MLQSDGLLGLPQLKIFICVQRASDIAAIRYKDVMWTKIQPGASGVSFDTCGDQGDIVKYSYDA